MIHYPVDFIKEAKDLYPEWSDLHEALDFGQKIVGEMLEKVQGLPLDEDQIVVLFRYGNEKKILEIAQRTQRKRKLYNKWIQVIDNLVETRGIGY
jgi:hypothetical protein